MRRRRECLRLTPLAVSSLRLCLLIGSSAWVILVFGTLLYLTTYQEEKEKNPLVASPHKLQRTVVDKVPLGREDERHLPLEIFVQEHVHQSWRITNSSSLPRRLRFESTLNQQQIDCQEPYRTIPLLLDIDDDPFLPWIHDYFVSQDNTKVRFMAQNRRRCHTGRGKTDVMAYWESQMALLQPISVAMDLATHRYYLTEPEQAHYPETRFLCRFHSTSGSSGKANFVTTLSEYPFNYEYLNWRKRAKKPMFAKDGPDVEIFDYATLLFSCPIPVSLRNSIKQRQDLWYLDVAPIRTPARYDHGYLLTAQQVGQEEFAALDRFNVTHHYGNHSFLPKMTEMGRIANLPVCPTHDEGNAQQQKKKTTKRHKLVGCVWVAASYARRGGRGASVLDTPQRMKEWLTFHRLAGYSHIYVYDNTQVDDANGDENDESRFPLKVIANLFSDFVTWIRWPAKVCNNNFTGGRWPGERSSQYAAEASCRERFGPHTEWMSFMDIDEYFVPIGNDTWGAVLDSKGSKSPVLGLRESRTRPLQKMMVETTDPKACSRPEGNVANKELGGVAVACLVPRSNATFLSVYNCDSVKPPRPRGYSTNMKQIYRPDVVLSHFVHYAPVTRSIAEYYKDKADPVHFSRTPSFADKGLSFFDELAEATMLHARSVLPYETVNWRTACVSESKENCKVGFACSDSTEYVDKLADKKLFVDEQGGYCNCWRNHHIEKWLPKLEAALQKLG